jgi:hypothetical protein
MSKERAAKIANSPGASKTGRGTFSREEKEQLIRKTLNSLYNRIRCLFLILLFFQISLYK